MAKRLTIEDFIAKAREAHGNRYDYSKSEYVTAHDKMVITCRDHGDFSQTANSHKRGSGCPECGDRRKSIDQWLVRAKIVHGDKYDYSKVNYSNSRTKITIICKQHGEFEQRADAHLDGRGCPACFIDDRRLTTGEFVAKARHIHSDRYEYSKVEYLGAHKPVIIVCHEHGQFNQIPSNHLSGAGCAYCAGRGEITTEKFVEEARKVHGRKYDYSKVEYKNNKTRVFIICSEHGVFEQIPTSHLRGGGCPRCAGVFDTLSFIEKAHEVHGDKYDYSKTIYQGSKVKATINCPDHGEFEQEPRHHASGVGCPSCGLVKLGLSQRLNAGSSFVPRARELHGDKYDYSKIEYVSANSKIIIICPEHGEFEQTPSSHLSGRGCRFCGHEVRAENSKLTTQEFLDRSREVHGDTYDYTRTVYSDSTIRVAIVCPLHGEFEQAPFSHLAGCGCPICADIRVGDFQRLPSSEFISRSIKLHGEKYDYSQTEYSGMDSKVTIVCPDHGEFRQNAASHCITGYGCPHCSGNAPLTREIFIDRALDIHGAKYDYSEVEYINSQKKVTIICPEHGEFRQSPNKHLSMRGCPGCAVSGFDATKSGILYYLRIERFNQLPLYKIGITNRSVAERFANAEDRSRISIVEQWRFEVGGDAVDLETQVLRQFREHKYKGSDILMSGNTELFTKDVLGLDAGPDR